MTLYYRQRKCHRVGGRALMALPHGLAGCRDSLAPYLMSWLTRRQSQLYTMRSLLLVAPIMIMLPWADHSVNWPSRMIVRPSTVIVQPVATQSTCTGDSQSAPVNSG